jgi:hypothetical protein
MNPLRPTRRRLATCLSLAISILAAGAALAAPDPQLQEVDSGKGWRRLLVVDADTNIKGGGPPPLMADLLVVTPDGIDDLPIAQMHKDELYEDFYPPKTQISGQQVQQFGGEPENPEAIVIDYAALEQIETGIWRPEYLAIAEQPDVPTGEGEAPELFGCSGWKDKHVSKTWSLNNSPLSQNFNLGGGFSGNFSVQLPFVTTGTGTLNYQYKRNFLCIPYKFRVKNVQTNGSAALGGSAQLSATASLNYQWEHDFQIANPHLGRIYFMVGWLPVWIDFDLPITAGLKLDAKLAGTVAQNFDLGAAGSFHYTCTSSSCTGGNSFQDTFSTSGLTASLSAELEAEANAKVQVRAALYNRSLLNARAGVKGFVKAKVWAYYGNNCGDGNGDGTNETVRAATAEVDAGFDFVYGIGGAVVPDYSGSVNGPRFDLGWWDLLGAGGSTVFSPMIAGPATAEVGQNVSYVVRMRPCYPYTQAVNLQMGPGAWNGTLKITKPKSAFPAENSTTLSRSFPAPGGAQTIVATAVSDSDGRTLQAATSRLLQVQNPVQIQPRGGHWYNPDRSGNGVELFVNMYGHYTAIWYTYAGSEPVWYISDTTAVQNGQWSAGLYRSTWTGSSNQLQVVGNVGFTFSSDSQGTFHWQLDGASGDEPFHHLFGGSGRSGSWYPPSESGWGISIAEDSNLAVVTVQYYSGGQPTWAMGSATPGPTLVAPLVRHFATGLCPGCTGPIQRWTENAGTITVANPPTGYHLLVSTDIPGWQRPSLPFYQLASH